MVNHYFLIIPDGPIAPLPTECSETSQVRCVRAEEARALIEQTKNPNGRKRDFAVLEAGPAARVKHRS